MPRVRVLRTFRRGDTGEVCRVGAEVEAPDAMVRALVAHGYARPVASQVEVHDGAGQTEGPENETGDATGAGKGSGKKKTQR